LSGSAASGQRARIIRLGSDRTGEGHDEGRNPLTTQTPHGDIEEDLDDGVATVPANEIGPADTSGPADAGPVNAGTADAGTVDAGGLVEATGTVKATGAEHAVLFSSLGVSEDICSGLAAAGIKTTFPI
jgi:hypothetical protein